MALTLLAQWSGSLGACGPRRVVRGGVLEVTTCPAALPRLLPGLPHGVGHRDRGLQSLSSNQVILRKIVVNLPKVVRLMK